MTGAAARLLCLAKLGDEEAGRGRRQGGKSNGPGSEELDRGGRQGAGGAKWKGTEGEMEVSRVKLIGELGDIREGEVDSG